MVKFGANLRKAAYSEELTSFPLTGTIKSRWVEKKELTKYKTKITGTANHLKTTRQISERNKRMYFQRLFFTEKSVNLIAIKLRLESMR